jgi:hypothetical protein
MEVADAITGSDPCKFPSHVKLSQESQHNHVVHGCGFEVAMQLFAVDQCTCCGKVQPGNIAQPDDPCYKPPFECKALTNVYRAGWHCTCHRFCNRSQFYAAKDTHVDYYQQKHNGFTPWEVLGILRGSTNAVLCNKCYKLPKDHLHFHRKYSLMNGFGPIHVPPSPSEGEDRRITKSRELNALLKSFTSAEEGGIRRIAPLVRINRLKQGNIGMMGNTSCAHVHSMMATLLLNLQSECNFIILTRKN